MSVKLTVIIPTYNRANILAGCLDSILCSDYENMEVLVSDNASPDSTPEILRAFNDKRLQYSRNETNIGCERNILKLLQQASGDYVIIMTDDALLNRNSIHEILRIIQAHPDVGFIMGARQMIDEKSKEPFRDLTYGDCRLLKAGRESFSNLGWSSGFIPGTVIRRDLIDMEGYRKYISSMSPYFYIAGIAMKKAPAYYTAVLLVTCTICNKVYWEFPTDFNIRAQMEIVKELWSEPEEKEYRDMLIQQMVKAQSRCMTLLCRADQCKSPRRYWQYINAILSIPEVRQSRDFRRNSILCLIGFPFIKLAMAIAEIPVVRPAYVKLRRRLG